jgi:hypothetical protein
MRLSVGDFLATTGFEIVRPDSVRELVSEAGCYQAQSVIVCAKEMPDISNQARECNGGLPDRIRSSNALSLLIIFAIFIVMIGVDLPGNMMLWEEVQNSCHAPAFGFFAIALLVLLRNNFPQYRHAQSIYYLLSLGISVVAGTAIEIIQYLLQRDAQYIDVVRDFVGAASFLGVYFTFDSRITYWTEISRRPARYVIRMMSLLIFVSAFISLGFGVTAYFVRNQEFPQICNFGSLWSDQFVKLQDATLTKVSPPVGWPDLNQSHVFRLCLEKSEYPGLTIEEPYPDWSSYETFCADLYSDRRDTLLLGLRIDDLHHNYSDNDRFTCGLVVAPGVNLIRIPLEQVRGAPTERETDMKAIQRIILFGHQPKQPVIVYLERFWLE